MTSLNPSHIPSSSGNPRHGQAVHQTRKHADSPDPSEGADAADADADGYPPIDALEETRIRKARRVGREKIDRVVPAIPDLRFEQSYLLSIRPFLTPAPRRQDPHGALDQSGDGLERHDVEGEDSKTLTTSADQDEVFHWGREVQVDWKQMGWVTLRDQLMSPLFQGALWGTLSLVLSASSAVARSTIYPAGHQSKGRVVGGSGGGAKSGAGEVVGDESRGGWWRSWVGSWAGAVESVFA